LKPSEIMEVLGNNDTYGLFNTIAEKVSIDSQLLQSINGFSKAQYYKRIQKLIACGLVKRKYEILSLTAFGKVVNSGKLRIDIAVAEFYRLKALDLVKVSKGIGEEEERKLVDQIIKDTEIKPVLLGKNESDLSSRAESLQHKE
jgi:hypothetical protein